jgi:Spy/CpxP family protein refolding chaperone
MKQAIVKATRRRTILAGLAVLLCAFAGRLPAQGPPLTPGSRASGFWWESPWWNGAAAQGLNLTETQKTDINGIVKDYRSKMMDLRSTVDRADKDVAAAFGENPVDQKKANDAIEKLAASRGELTRTLSQMSLKLRMVLTADQWQELQQRSIEARNGRGKGRGRRTDAARSGQAPPSAAKQ